MRTRRATPVDHTWIHALLVHRWGSSTIYTLRRKHDACALPAWIAEDTAERRGLLTYHLSADGLEIVTLDALRPRCGIGTELIHRVKQTAHEHGAHRLWLVTTNDNLDAIRFYQRRGFRFQTVHQGLVDQMRQHKPAIPTVGHYGIPIHDAIELSATS